MPSIEMLTQISFKLCTCVTIQISKIFKSPQIIFLGSQGLEFISKDYPPFTCDMDMYEKCINNLRYTHVRKVELVDFVYTDTTILYMLCL